MSRKAMVPFVPSLCVNFQYCPCCSGDLRVLVCVSILLSWLGHDQVIQAENVSAFHEQKV